MTSQNLKGKEQLPQGWVILPLSDCVYFQEGPGLRKKQFGEQGIPFLNIRTFEKGFIDKTKCKFIEEKEFTNKYEHFLLNEGDIVVSSSGTIGKTAVIRKQDLPVMLNTSVIRFRSLSDNLLFQDYLKYYVQSQHFFKQINSAKTGSAIDNYGPTHLQKMCILVPPLNEQKRITAKLDRLLTKVNEAKERLDRIPTILKRFRQSVLYSACSGKLTADWREKHPDIESAEVLLQRIQEERIKRYEEECAKVKAEGKKPPKELLKDQPKKIDDSLLYSIPETWSWSNFINLGELNRGKSKHRPRNAPQLFGGPYPFIQTGDIARANMIINTHTQTYSEIGLAQSRLFPTNTLCITIAANIADTAILSYPACFPDSVVGFIPEKDFFEGFFALYYMKTIQNHLERFAPATAQKNINIRILNTIPIPVPPIEEQKEIVRRVQALFKKCDIIEERYLKAKAYTDKLTKSILAKAFRGELVPQDPNDEPAELLLERIRAGKVKTEPKPKTSAAKSKK